MSKFTTVQTVFSRNLPAILTGMSVAGMAVTIWNAKDDTIKAVQILEERRAEEFNNDDTFDDFTAWEMVKESWTCYLPTMIFGSIAIGCTIASQSINARRNAVLAGLYTLSENTFKEYQHKVIEKIGEKKHREVKDEIAKDRLAKVSLNNIIITGNGNTLCLDALSGRLFRSDIEFIKQVVNDFNRRLMTEMWKSLNELYYDLGLESNRLGEAVGWHIDEGFVEPEFSSQLTEDGIPCLVMDFNFIPRQAYYK